MFFGGLYIIKLVRIGEDVQGDNNDEPEKNDQIEQTFKTCGYMAVCTMCKSHAGKIHAWQAIQEIACSKPQWP